MPVESKLFVACTYAYTARRRTHMCMNVYIIYIYIHCIHIFIYYIYMYDMYISLCMYIYIDLRLARSVIQIALSNEVVVQSFPLAASLVMPIFKYSDLYVGTRLLI
jgi:hypothetical protein